MCTAHKHTSGEGHQNPTGAGHFKDKGQTNNGSSTTGGTEGGVAPSIGKKQAVIHKDYVLDYTSAPANVIMETESGVGGLTYRYTYGRDKVSAAITGQLNGAGNLVQDGQVKLWYHHDRMGSTEYLTDNVSGSTAASYSYDAWGRILSSTGTLASVNPIRYRGYYYDSETGFYYLQSRYYDPEICRFINADDTSLIGANGNFLSYNLFAYCGNNPVVREDAEGDFWITAGIMAIGGAIGAVVSAATSAVTQKVLTGTVNWNSVLVAAGSGFVSGAIAASPLGLVGQKIAGGIIGGLSYVADCYFNDRAMRLDEAIVSVGMGVLSGKIGGAGANEGFTLTKLIDGSKRIADRELRRANQQYAQKAIASTMGYRNNTLSYTAWGASARFAAGCGASNGAMGGLSRVNTYWDVPEWKPW